MQPQRTCKVGCLFSIPQHLHGPTFKFHPSTDSLSSTPYQLYAPLLTKTDFQDSRFNECHSSSKRESLGVLLGQDSVNTSYILSLSKLDSQTWFQAYRGILINYNCPLLKTKELLDKKVEHVFVCLLFIIIPGNSYVRKIKAVSLCEINTNYFSFLKMRPGLQTPLYLYSLFTLYNLKRGMSHLPTTYTIFLMNIYFNFINHFGTTPRLKECLLCKLTIQKEST